MSFNKVILVGNLTRDPESRVTPAGTSVINFALAVNRKWKTEDGQQKDEVSFVECVAFGRTAEIIAQHSKKGTSLLVDGRLKQDVWEDKNTQQKRSALKVIVETFTFVGAKSDDKPAPSARQQVKNKIEQESPPVEDDVPF